jgi:hypothetical protein
MQAGGRANKSYHNTITKLKDLSLHSLLGLIAPPMAKPTVFKFSTKAVKENGVDLTFFINIECIHSCIGRSHCLLQHLHLEWPGQFIESENSR